MEIAAKHNEGTNPSVKRIWALGTDGVALNKEFEARKNKSGRYSLNTRFAKDCKPGTKPNQAVNKHQVNTLEEALDLLKTGNYSINLTGCEPGTGRALRIMEELKIDFY